MAVDGPSLCDAIAVYGVDNVVTEVRFRNRMSVLQHVKAFRFDEVVDRTPDTVPVYEFDAPVNQWVTDSPPPEPMAVEWVDDGEQEPYANTVYFTDGIGNASDKEVTLVCRHASS